MSCKDPFPPPEWIHIKADLAARLCPQCGKAGLTGGESPMPLQSSLISEWQCPHCDSTLLFVVSEEGEVFRA